jgi:transcription initiation factor TFIID subunit 7
VTFDAPTPGPASEAGDTPAHLPGTEAEDVGEDDGEEGEGDIDEELAAELDLALGDDDAGADGDDDEDDDDDDESEEEEEDDEDEEGGQARKLLNEEIRDLQAAVTKKDREIASSGNPLIKVREVFRLAASVLSRVLCRNVLRMR